jgi:hypothetical protein
MMHLIQTIQETATWIERVNCDFEVNLFRSPELSPEHYFCEIPDSEKPAVVNGIVGKRAELLKQAGVDLIPVEELVNYGRIMFFDADSTLLDGAPEDVSAYYVDSADTPPWDTWIALGEQLNAISLYKNKLSYNLLVAWVPKSHYYYANEAVYVACIDNFEWPESELVNQSYAIIKELFTEPASIVEPDSSINYTHRKATLDRVMAQHEKNSAVYSAQFRSNKGN